MLPQLLERDLLSIDGKVIGNDLATLVSLVDAADAGLMEKAAPPFSP